MTQPSHSEHRPKGFWSLGQRRLHIHVHCSSPHSSQETETA